MNQSQFSSHANADTASHRYAKMIIGAVGVILLLLLTLLAYTTLHECGHLLMGLLFGGRVTSFNVNFFNLSAHVGLDGRFSPWQNGLISVAGVALPLLLWTVFIVRAPRQGHLLFEWAALAASMCVINSLLAWIVIPILTLNGQVIGDDSASFLSHTGLPPLLVAAAALLVYLGAWALYLRRSGGLRSLVANLRQEPLEFASPAARRALTAILAGGASVAALALVLGLAFGTGPTAAPPEGYSLVTSVDLSQSAFADRVVHRFSLGAPARVSLYLTLTEIQGTSLSIRLTGPDGYDNILFRVDDPAFKGIGLATLHPRDLALKPGEYQIRLSFPQGRGKIAIYSPID